MTGIEDGMLKVSLFEKSYSNFYHLFMRWAPQN